LTGCGGESRLTRADANSAPSGPVPGATVTETNSQELVGIWYLNASGDRLTLSLWWNAELRDLQGSMTEGDQGVVDAVDSITWDANRRLLQFRCSQPSVSLWYRVTVSEGVLAGRFAKVSASAVAPASLWLYDQHVTGWQEAVFSGDIVPRVWDLRIDDQHLARLRVDRPPTRAGELIGRFKIYASIEEGADDERFERDVTMLSWDGVMLSFVVKNDEGRDQLFLGRAQGRRLIGLPARPDRPDLEA